MSPEELHNRCSSRESFLMASDGQYLGRLTSNRYDSFSVLNEYGTFGSKYSTTSIWNPYCLYGGQYSIMSPFNPYTISPPLVYLRGIMVGHLSLNRYVLNPISPENLNVWIKNNYL